MKSAFLVIDPQRGFTSPEGTLGEVHGPHELIRIRSALGLLAEALPRLAVYSTTVLVYSHYKKDQFSSDSLSNHKGGLTTNANEISAKFIIEEMPVGLRGLLVAAVLSASMSTTSVVLNSISTVVSVDFGFLWGKYSSTVKGVRWMTLFSCLIVTILASVGGRFGNLLEASSHVISLFIGSMTGVFLLGMLSRRATATASFYGMLTGMAAAFIVNLLPISFLWLSPVSAIVTILTGLFLSMVGKQGRTEVANGLVYPAAPRSNAKRGPGNLEEESALKLLESSSKKS